MTRNRELLLAYTTYYTLLGYTSLILYTVQFLYTVYTVYTRRRRLFSKEHKTRIAEQNKQINGRNWTG